MMPLLKWFNLSPGRRASCLQRGLRGATQADDDAAVNSSCKKDRPLEESSRDGSRTIQKRDEEEGADGLFLVDGRKNEARTNSFVGCNARERGGFLP